MSMNTRAAVVLSKIESSYGVDPTPTGAANAVLCSQPTITPIEGTEVARGNVVPYLGGTQKLLLGVYSKLDIEVELAGSGTAGTPPPCGPLLRSCGLDETILATAETGTAQAGTTTSVTLESTASASDDAYKNMTIHTTGGTGSGQYAVIKSYNGTSKVATLTSALAVAPDVTTTYEIPEQVVYSPVETGFESTTNYFYVTDVLHKLTGSRGNASFMLPNLAIPKIKFSLQGLFNAAADGSAPTPVLTAWQTPKEVTNTNTVRPVVMGYAGSVISDFSADLANAVKYENLVGREGVYITDRDSKGSLTQEFTTVATKDWWGSVKASTLGVFSITHGIVAGNIVKIDAPQMQMLKPAYADKDGIRMLQTSLEFKPLAGDDELIITFM